MEPGKAGGVKNKSTDCEGRSGDGEGELPMGTDTSPNPRRECLALGWLPSLQRDRAHASVQLGGQVIVLIFKWIHPRGIGEKCGLNDRAAGSANLKQEGVRDNLRFHPCYLDTLGTGAPELPREREPSCERVSDPHRSLRSPQGAL